MKFHVHMFEDRRHRFLVEANSLEDAYKKVSESQITDLNEVEVENTGEYNVNVLVDALLADGTTDYDNIKWFPLYKATK